MAAAFSLSLSLSSSSSTTTYHTAKLNPRTADAAEACPIVATIMMMSVMRYIDLRPFLSARNPKKTWPTSAPKRPTPVIQRSTPVGSFPWWSG